MSCEGMECPIQSKLWLKHVQTRFNTVLNQNSTRTNHCKHQKLYDTSKWMCSLCQHTNTLHIPMTMVPDPQQDNTIKKYAAQKPSD